MKSPKSKQPDAADKADRLYTSKQMGDACEMLVAAELTLAGVPALKVSDNWPGYDVIAQPTGGKPPQRISVKSRTANSGLNYIGFDPATSDWLAIVLLLSEGRRQIFVVPQDLARLHSFSRPYRPQNPCGLRLKTIRDLFAAYANNFALKRHD
jgi:hypothetical protein